MDPLENAVTKALPNRSIEEIVPQNTRPGNEVGLITFANGESVYVKTATDTDRRLVREIAANRYAAANCLIEAPEVLAADTGESRPYLVMAPLPGTPLNDPWTDGEDRIPLLRQAGRTIAGVHSAEFDHPGRILGGDTDSLELTNESWTETLCETIRWRANDWFADRFVDLPEQLVATLQDARPLLDGVDATLLHADCSRINLHLDPNGLLDWERAVVGDPVFDLVDAYGHLIDQVDVDESEREDLKEALYEGYREVQGKLPHGLEVREPLYRPIAHLLVPQTFEEWAPPLEKPTEELAADVRDEFNSRLRNARQAIRNHE